MTAVHAPLGAASFAMPLGLPRYWPGINHPRSVVAGLFRDPTARAPERITSRYCGKRAHPSISCLAMRPISRIPRTLIGICGGRCSRSPRKLVYRRGGCGCFGGYACTDAYAHASRRLRHGRLTPCPNPYQTIENWAKLPEGANLGSTAGVAVDRQGNIWVAGKMRSQYLCESDLAPIWNRSIG